MASRNLYADLIRSGTAAARPTTPDSLDSSHPVFYYATDTNVLSINVGGTWFNIATLAVTTVANLPANPTTGQIAYVSDATTPAIGATVAGAGAVFCAVVWNGAAWKVA